MNVRHCKIEVCKAPAVAFQPSNAGKFGEHGLCRRHYDRLEREIIDIDGNYLRPLQRDRLRFKSCQYDTECLAEQSTAGLCRWHYRQYLDERRAPVALDDVGGNPDEDEKPLRLVPPQVPPVTSRQNILDLQNDETIHPDVILLNGIRFVPEFFDSESKWPPGTIQYILKYLSTTMYPAKPHRDAQ